ncbi:MAG: hypothetical protein ACLPVY_15395 [Acidimicrobiia bacterium]
MGQDAGLVVGTVVDRMTTRPLAGRTVVVGGTRVATGPDGSFRLAAPSIPYNAVVVEPDGSSVSVVLGLSRLDPTLVHTPSGTANNSTAAVQVSPTLSFSASSAPPGPAASGRVYAFSNAADNWTTLDVGADGGLTCAPIGLSWLGGGEMTGDLVGLLDPSNADAGGSWAAGQAQFALVSGQGVDVALPLSEVPSLTVSGQTALPPGYFLTRRDVSYRWPIVHAFVSVLSDPTPASTFEYTVPDVTSLGGVLCLEADAAPGTIATRVCGASLAPSSPPMQLQAAPEFSTSISGTSVPASGSWSWTTYDNGVYAIQIESDVAGPAAPDILILTANTTINWPDLERLGVPFTPGSGYAVTLGGLGPYSSIDDACGPNGLGNPFPEEQRWSYALTVAVSLAH